MMEILTPGWELTYVAPGGPGILTDADLAAYRRTASRTGADGAL